jgi:hypothetical protein
MLPRPALTGWNEETASAMGKHQERHDHIWECYSIVFFDCGSSSRSQRPFFFSFSFSYLNFRLFLVGFSIDVDSPRSLVRSFDCWTFAFQSGEKRTKRKTNKAPDCSNVVQSID